MKREFPSLEIPRIKLRLVLDYRNPHGCSELFGYQPKVSSKKFLLEHSILPKSIQNLRVRHGGVVSERTQHAPPRMAKILPSHVCIFLHLDISVALFAAVRKKQQILFVIRRAAEPCLFAAVFHSALRICKVLGIILEDNLLSSIEAALNASVDHAAGIQQLLSSLFDVEYIARGQLEHLIFLLLFYDMTTAIPKGTSSAGTCCPPSAQITGKEGASGNVPHPSVR